MQIKRLYSYLIKSYIGTFIATFLVCLFVVLMQFLWKYVDEMVGKGLEISVLAEFFFYAALSLISMALPLAILLSSLITFGNLGEKLELLAMKAAGISLFRIMRPYILFISIISIGAFFYSNVAMPIIQTKLWTLLFSMRQKSPEVEIPEGSFYQGIEDYHIYVKEKDKKTKLLKNIMIYDFSRGFDNAVVFAADSGYLRTASDKQSLLLTLYSGESFENLKEQRNSKQNVPYRRETYSQKELLIEFDANFSKVDESIMSNRYMGKNLHSLSLSIDSMRFHRDSTCRAEYQLLKSHIFDRGLLSIPSVYSVTLPQDLSSYTLENRFANLPAPMKTELIDRALQQTIRMKLDLPFLNSIVESDNRRIYRFDIERHRKFTLSLACLVFFFIGAPLGAIIRKGGLGLPAVISVILFLIYYIIDNTGYKMAREGVWFVWQGIWLSSFILFPLGISLTYLAATDKSINVSSIYNFFKDLSKKMKSFLKKRRSHID